jgi:hypothetical protein
MYSRKAWGGNVDPFILVKFSKAENLEGDPLASLVIFEWNDEELIGQYRSADAEVCPRMRVLTELGTDRNHLR